MKKIIPLVFLIFCWALNPAQATPQLGPQLKARMLADASERSISFRTGWSVVFFLGTSCPCSQSHLAHLSELARAHPQVKFLGVHTDGYTSSSEALKHFKALNLPFEIVDDHDFTWARTFEAMKTPEVFLISAAGKIEYAGAVSDSASFEAAKKFYLQELLGALEQGAKIPYHHKKALGCYITFERRDS